jgi:hypothetical protein
MVNPASETGGMAMLKSRAWRVAAILLLIAMLN